MEIQAKKVYHRKKIDEFAKDVKVSEDHLKRVGIYPETMTDLINSLSGKKTPERKRSPTTKNLLSDEAADVIKERFKKNKTKKDK